MLWLAIPLGLAVVAVLAFIPSLMGEPAALPTTTTSTPVVTIEPPPTTRPHPTTTAPNYETSIGTLTWIGFEGGEDSIPFGRIYIDPVHGGYVIYENGAAWHSDDGLTWERGESPFGDAYSAYVVGNWAFASDATGPETDLYRLDGGSWVAVELPEPDLPVIPGMEWSTNLNESRESGGVTLIPFQSWASVPWGDLYGTTEHECGLPEPCEEPPWGEWKQLRPEVWVHGPSGQIATLVVSQRDSDLVLTDSETEVEIHRITFDSAPEAASFAESAHSSNGQLFEAGVWVVTEDGVVSYQPPWERQTTILSLPSGFVAFEGVNEWPRAEDDEHHVWTSADGVEWENMGRPAFLPEGYYEFVELDRLGDLLVAELVAQWGAEGPTDITRWVSPDGVNWVEEETALPVFAYIQPAEWGWAAVEWLDDGVRFFVSTDAETWEAVSGPADTKNAVWFRDAGTVGDMLYLQIENGPNRELWIGRFHG